MNGDFDSNLWFGDGLAYEYTVQISTCKTPKTLHKHALCYPIITARDKE